MGEYKSAYTGKQIDAAVKTVSELPFPIPLNKGGTGTANPEDARKTFGAAGKWNVLWENASPSSTFKAQTLILSTLNNYERFMIIVGYQNANVRTAWPIYIADGDTSHKITLFMVPSTSLTTVTRQVTFNKTEGTIEFESADTHSTSNSSSTNNDRVIPLFILGARN